MRQLLEEWKAAPRADRAVEAALWKRLSAARNAFTKRRKAYFADLEEEREAARAAQGEAGRRGRGARLLHRLGPPPPAAFRDLMRLLEGSRAGRPAPRRTPCGAGSRPPRTPSSTPVRRCYSAKDARAARARGGQVSSCWRRPGKLVPVTDVRAARAALRGIQERWEQAGPVPREAHERLETGLRRVEDAVRKAEDAQWRRSNPEALARAQGTVEQIRSAIAELEAAARQGHASAATPRRRSRRRRPSPPAGPGSPRPSAPWPNCPGRSRREGSGAGTPLPRAQGQLVTR